MTDNIGPLFEQLVAFAIDDVPEMTATVNTNGVQYSDVRVDNGFTHSWVEVKTKHSDNLANPRFWYNGSMWVTGSRTNIAHTIVDMLNESEQAKDFIKRLARFTGHGRVIQPPLVLRSSAGKKKVYPEAVSLEMLKSYFDCGLFGDRYIMTESCPKLAELVIDHYVNCKKEPVPYMQVGHSFYRLSDELNPLGVSTEIPLLSGTGDVRVRVATRSRFYEIQAEIKMSGQPESEWSVFGHDKRSPFRELS